jgi:alkylation response protein AidB-like acyl-CoA dehydrogenase
MLDRLPNEPSAAERERRAAELIGRARELIPSIDRASDRIERERRIPADVLDALHEARLFRLLIPRSLDGEEVEPATLFQVIEAVAQGDASVGWCLGQGSGVSMSAAYLKPEVARKIFGDKRAVVACGPNNPKALARRSSATAATASPANGALPAARATPDGCSVTLRCASRTAGRARAPTASRWNCARWRFRSRTRP